MAINYLNSIDLNKNEILQGVIENQPNDAAAGASPVEGQLYFNTTNHVLMQYNGTSWEEAGGGVETLTTSDGTYIDLTPNAPTDGAVTVTADLSAVDGTAVAATRFLSKDNTWDVPAFPTSDNYDYWVLDADGAGATAQIGSGDTADFVGGLKIGTNSTAGGTLNITHDLQTQTDSTSVASPADGATFTVVDSVTRDTTGHATGLNVKTITLPSFPAIPTVGDGQINGATSGLGISGSMSATANQSGDTTFTVASNASIGPTVSTLMHRDTSGYGYVVTPASGSNDTTIPTTAWVQAKLTGLLEFKGGFNATSGELDDGSGNDLYTDVVIAVGDYYVVTTAGNFFGNTATPLTVGDSVIAQNAVIAPGTTAPVESDFIVVQSDTDLATLATVGLGNVNKSTVATLDGISVAYSAGTASVGLDIQGLTYITSTLATDDLNGIEIPIYNGEAATAANEKIEIADLVPLINNKYNDKDTIPIGDLAGTVTHNWNTKNTIVQTIDQNGDTVFCDITRTTSTVTATISVAQTAATGGIITILVQRIG